MSAPTKTIVEIPHGCHCGSMHVHADSWEAYDALQLEDGWTVKFTANYEWKQLGDGNGYSGWIAVHPPHAERAS